MTEEFFQKHKKGKKHKKRNLSTELRLAFSAIGGSAFGGGGKEGFNPPL